jgi:hypothetical protein
MGCITRAAIGMGITEFAVKGDARAEIVLACQHGLVNLALRSGSVDAIDMRIAVLRAKGQASSL